MKLKDCTKHNPPRSLGFWMMAAAWMTGVALQAASAPGEPAIITRAPYLQLATPNSIYVVWRTDRWIPPVIKYGPQPTRLTQAVPGVQITTRISLGKAGANKSPAALELRQPQYARLPKLHSAPAGTVQYEALITGLKPDRRYYYAIFEGDRPLTPADPSYSFATHPVPGAARSTRFWVVGDSGVGREPQISVHQAMRSRVQRDRRPLDFLVHVGDMAYDDGRDAEFQTRFFAIYDTTLRNTVCWPAMGNHEGHTSRGMHGTGPYYDAYILPKRGEAGGLPSGTEAYYSFDYGQIHFICLDSYDLDRTQTGAMAQWLRADLNRTRAQWLMAFWHHPPYSKGTHDSDTELELVEMRTHIMPILESGGVDIVLSGHSHIYERSMLMDGAYATPTVADHVILDDGDGDPRGDGPYRKSAGLRPHEGTVQVVAGHGGANLGRKGTCPVMKRIILEHGSVIMDVQGDTLTGIMINKDGSERDRFSVVKRGTVSPTRVPNPRLLPPYTPPPDSSTDSSRDLPENVVPLIEPKTAWLYLAGSHPTSTNWADLNFPATGWREGRASFGYGGGQKHATPLNNMKNRYQTVYLRRAFVLSNAEDLGQLGLVVNYDDAFIAYLNGHEVLRRGVGGGRGAAAKNIQNHKAEGYQYFPIPNQADHLLDGRNVLAIEGHNRSLDSSDFTLDPYLVVAE